MSNQQTLLDLPHYIDAKPAHQHIAILANCYQAYFAAPLFTDSTDEAELLTKAWQAGFVLLSHGIGDDPVFNFANKTAQKLFEMDYLTLTSLPSRKSAGSSTQAERDQLLAEVSSKGCIDDYSGIRVSASGKQFFIERAKVWNLTDEAGNYYGQAAMFNSWTAIT
ncbi:MAG: MEKHLA domain-containing protein [Oceanospirillaceae bacterium]